ncbi:MAG: hypothetical protein CBD58_02525 [bacterium TMED198]|nr:MAG: hypothetical protein CBD58_02525 [bacterium TMED198]
MSESKRYLVAGLLVFLIILLNPLYYELIGYNNSYDDELADQALTLPSEDLNKKSFPLKEPAALENKTTKSQISAISDQSLEIITPLYRALLSNSSGGSLELFSILEQDGLGQMKYLGQIEDSGEYNEETPVQLILNNDDNLSCKPCIYDPENNLYFNKAFQLQSVSINGRQSQNDSNQKITINLELNDSASVVFRYALETGQAIIKTTAFYGKNYLINHNYELEGLESAEVAWMGGLSPVEKKEYDDNPNTLVYYSQSGDRDYTSAINENEKLSRVVVQEKYPIDWVALRNKYFITSLISRSHADYIVYSGENVDYANRSFTPMFNFGLGYKNPSNIQTSMYIGPLEIDQVNKSNASLSTAMDFGWGPMKYIGMAILYFVKKIHHLFGLNYGLVLILFACLMRLITGPLTKKSFQSTQKMQLLQPEIKKLQEKYKKDSARMQKETMALYQKHGANPLGGCLPMLIQMPVLISLFQVFRYTIEFRNEPFFLWISDLSQPDVVFNLPFYIPLYGDGVAILPLVMGASLIMTMKISSATMDPAQKPMMYIMNIFFIVLFNTFPSGLNLYYTTYNFLNYFQQKKIKQNSFSKK